MSRFVAPGSTMHAWWETADYKTVNGDVVVMATSRHKRSLTDTEALEVLRDAWDEGVTIDRIGYWHTVTQADLENGLPCVMDDIEAGSWVEDASGKAWMKVAYPTVHNGGSDG